MKNQLRDLLQQVMDRTISVFEANDLVVPTNKIIATHQYAWDTCDLLAVCFRSVKPSRGHGSPNPLVSCSATTVVELTVLVLRCAGTECASEGGENEQALARADDAWVLQTEMLKDAFAGTLFPDGCTDISWQGVDPVGPQGGCAGSRLTITVQLDPR